MKTIRSYAADRPYLAARATILKIERETGHSICLIRVGRFARAAPRARHLNNYNSTGAFLHKFRISLDDTHWCVLSIGSDRAATQSTFDNGSAYFIGSSGRSLSRCDEDEITVFSVTFFYVLVIVCLMRKFIICWADENCWWAIGRRVKVGGCDARTDVVVDFLAFCTSEWVIQVVTTSKSSNSSTEVNNLPHIL